MLARKGWEWRKSLWYGLGTDADESQSGRLNGCDELDGAEGGSSRETNREASWSILKVSTHS
jgi:hypothetical protein